MLRKGNISSTSSAYLELHEFPLLNWIKCNEGEFRYINRDLVSTEFDVKNWAVLHDKYLEKYGISKEFKKYLDDKKRVIQMRDAYIQSGEKFILNEIRILELSIENQDRIFSNNKTTIENTLVWLSKWLGVALKVKDLTIVEYKNFMLEYERTNK